MRFIRKHGQQNLIMEDHCNDKPKLLHERLSPEIFENVKSFRIQTTRDIDFVFEEGDKHNIGDIIEGHNLFTFVRKDGKKITTVRYDWVTCFEFDLE